jgi:hypothetical protein
MVQAYNPNTWKVKSRWIRKMYCLNQKQMTGKYIFSLFSHTSTINIWYFFLCLFVCLFVFQDRVSLCSLGCPGTHSVDQAGLELRNLPASASQVLGLKACATTAQLFFFFSPYGTFIIRNHRCCLDVVAHAYKYQDSGT